MAPDRVEVHHEALVPLQGTRQVARGPFDVGPAIDGVEHQRLHVEGEVDDPVDVRLHVAVEVLDRPGSEVVVGPPREVEGGGGPEVLGLEDGVGVAERRPLERVRSESKVRRAEPRGAAHAAQPVVERAVLGSLVGRRPVVGATEDALLPAPPVTTRVRSEASVARAGLELGAVGAGGRQGPQDRDALVEAVGVEVERDPERGLDRPA